MKKKVFAFILCLVMCIAPITTLGVFAADDNGYTLDDTGKLFTVTTADGLIKVVNEINTSKKDYNVKLDADLDFTGKTWVPLGNTSAAYCGTFDGGNHTISGIVLSTEGTELVSIIGVAGAGCTVKNLWVKNINIKSGAQNVGAIIGSSVQNADGTVTVNNVHVRSSVIETTCKYGYAGGIIGCSGAKFHKISNCSVVATITAGQGRAVGLIAGENTGSATEGIGITFENCIVAGTYTCNYKSSSNAKKLGAAGLMGNHSTIPISATNCISVADVILGENSTATAGSLFMNFNKFNMNVTNCIGKGPIVGNVLVNGGAASLTGTYIYDETATADTASVLFETSDDSAMAMAITVGGTETTWANAKVPTVKAHNTLVTKVKEIFASNDCITPTMIDDIIHIHVYDQEKADSALCKTPATCTEAAVYYKSCACGAYDESSTFTSGAPLGHTPSNKWTNDEENHWHICTECLEEKSDLAAHTYPDEWTIVKEATKTREGERSKACTACGYEITEKIPKVTKTAEAEGDAADGTDATDTEESGGCGATVIGMGTVLIATIGACTVCAKKKRD